MRTSVRTFVGSSLATTPAEAVLEVAERLRAQGFRPSPGQAALCFVGQALLDPNDEGATDAHAAMHLALGDLLPDVPFIAFVGRSVFHDQRVPERRAALVVLVLDGVAAEARHALLHEHGMQTVAPLLADGMRATLRFLAHNGAAGHEADILAALDGAGGDVVGGVAARPLRQLLPGVSLLSLDGPRTVCAVSHATRLLGPARTVTAATHNVIRELDGRPALEVLLADLPAALRGDVNRLGGALFCAFEIDDSDAAVVRTVTGIDPRIGAVAVNERPSVGAEVAFSLRDQAAARDDLEESLAALQDALGDRRPRAFVVFSSAARDATLFGAPLWDVTRVLSRFGPDVPVVGASSRFEIATFGRRTLAFSQAAVVAAILDGAPSAA